MDVIQLLEEMGEVPPRRRHAIDAAIDRVLTAAFQERICPPMVPPTTELHRRRSVVVGAAALIAAAAAVLAIVALVPRVAAPTPPLCGRRAPVRAATLRACSRRGWSG